MKPSPVIFRKAHPTPKGKLDPKQDEALNKYAFLLADILGSYMDEDQINELLGGEQKSLFLGGSVVARFVKDLCGGKDKRGHKFCIDNGKRAKCPKGAEAPACTPKQLQEKGKRTAKPRPPKVGPSPLRAGQRGAEIGRAKKTGYDSAKAKTELDTMSEGGWDDEKVTKATSMLGDMKVTELQKLRKQLGIKTPPRRKADLMRAIKKKLAEQKLSDEDVEIGPIDEEALAKMDDEFGYGDDIQVGDLDEEALKRAEEPGEDFGLEADEDLPTAEVENEDFGLEADKYGDTDTRVDEYNTPEKPAKETKVENKKPTKHSWEDDDEGEYDSDVEVGDIDASGMDDEEPEDEDVEVGDIDTSKMDEEDEEDLIRNTPFNADASSKLREEYGGKRLGIFRKKRMRR
jgi:hypothetical protein